jgi:hypothetical protein
MAEKLLFYYLGDDEAYFKALQGEFTRHSKLSITFVRFFEKEETKIQSLFLKVFKDKPDCVFIDFSKFDQDYLHLARLLSRTPMNHKMVLVGMVDYLSPPEVLQESIVTGVNLCFVKSAEIFDVVFSVSRIVTEEDSGHGFATADCQEEVTAGVPVKIGFINSDGIHIETSYGLRSGDKISVEHHWLGNKLIPSKLMFVKNTSTTNLFYQFHNAADLDFLFVDEMIPNPEWEPAILKEKQSEREDQIKYAKKQLIKWLDDNLSRSYEKKSKVLVIDSSIRFLQDQPRTDKHPYTIRCHSHFKDTENEIKRLSPQIIAFQLDSEGPDAVNNMEELTKLIETVKTKLSDLKPFLIIFNSKVPSVQLQKDLQYSQIIAHAEELSPELLIRMAEMLEKKLKLTPAPKEKRVYLRKTNPASIAEFNIQIKIVKISESDLVFQGDFPFIMGTNIHLTEPVNMYVNIQPVKAQGKVPEYQGLIHGIGEDEKKDLRKFVNTVFFRDHDAQLQTELDEFKKLNELKLQEKADAEKAAKEAAEKAQNAEKEGESSPEKSE